MLTYALIVVQNYLATLKREEGQGMAEYGLILALVAVAIAAAFTLLGEQISGLLERVGDEFGVADPISFDPKFQAGMVWTTGMSDYGIVPPVRQADGSRTDAWPIRLFSFTLSK